MCNVGFKQASTLVEPICEAIKDEKNASSSEDLLLLALFSHFVGIKDLYGSMSSTTLYLCDYDMGDYPCSDGSYKDAIDYGGHESSHDHELHWYGTYYFRGEYEKTSDHRSYGEDGEEK